MGGCWLCPRVGYSFAAVMEGCLLCLKVGYSLLVIMGGMLVVSDGRVFFCWLLWGDVGCVQGSGILLLAVMEGYLLCLKVGYSLLVIIGGCWLCLREGYSFAGYYGGMLVVSEVHVFFFWLLWGVVYCV